MRIATCKPLPEPDPDEELLLHALRDRGVRARMAAWNDAREDWDARVPTLVRSTWDYIHHLEEFRAWIARASRAGPLWNPAHVLLGNLHKRYLLELAARGVPTVPTELVERGARTRLSALARARDWSDVVIKPAVGAGSFETHRFRFDAFPTGDGVLAGLSAERDMLVQPYLPSVESHGERALVWIAGEFTHAVRKTPRFSGHSEDVSHAMPISPAERAVGEQALAPLAKELLYARVDVAPGLDGKPQVMELELVEPSLFLVQHPPALERLARTVRDRLGALKD